jgi:hypothetical protein
MGGYANRVIDSYTKKFETCNETYRKIKESKEGKENKEPKKDRGQPFLVNLPLYLKHLNQDENYKTCLISKAISEFGPTDKNPIFYELLISKSKNFNDFKKPKSLDFDYSFASDFMSLVYKIKAATKVFEALKNT